MKQLNEIKRMQQLAGIITESQLNEAEDNQIKDFILSNFDYNEDEFDSNYNADSGLEDLVNAGSYDEAVYFDDNDTDNDFYPKLLEMIKNSPLTQHNSWGDYYENKWVLKEYPFEDSGENWTESLVVKIHIPKGDYSKFDRQYAQVIEIERSVPFDEKMKDWWEKNYQ